MSGESPSRRFLAQPHRRVAQSRQRPFRTIKDRNRWLLPAVDVSSGISIPPDAEFVTDSNGYFTVPGLHPESNETRASLQFRTACRTASRWRRRAGRASTSS